MRLQVTGLRSDPYQMKSSPAKTWGWYALTRSSSKLLMGVRGFVMERAQRKE